MALVSPTLFDVETLHVRLRERLVELRPLVVAEVMRAFLEVSTLPCEKMLWSLEFAFDEDDGRIARLEARFAEPSVTYPPAWQGAASHGEYGDFTKTDLVGYEVHVLLPHVIPSRPNADALRAAKEGAESLPEHGLVERFVRAYAELGAYRAIEPLVARSAEVYLL